MTPKQYVYQCTLKWIRDNHDRSAYEVASMYEARDLDASNSIFEDLCIVYRDGYGSQKTFVHEGDFMSWLDVIS